MDAGPEHCAPYPLDGEVVLPAEHPLRNITAAPATACIVCRPGLFAVESPAAPAMSPYRPAAKSRSLCELLSCSTCSESCPS